MATTPQHDSRKPSIGRSRPTAAVLQSSPHTPLSRSISGLYGSPSASFRSDDDNHLILEIGARTFRAGFAGDNAPRCVTTYSPELQRRVGDYRAWSMGYEYHVRKRKRGQDWGQDHELWRMDVQKVDIKLMQDKLERVLREVENKYLMLDSRQRKITMAIPSSMPRPLLSPVLMTLFSTLQPTTITLLPTAVMSAVGGGVRSALVVDIGWEETTATAVCEYMEILQCRSVRAGKLLSKIFQRLLLEEYWKIVPREDSPASSDSAINFEQAEELMARLGWCQTREQSLENADPKTSQSIMIPLAGADSHMALLVPFERFAEPVERALLGRDLQQHQYDDHDLPLPSIMFKALLQLPVDVRKLCMSRIIFTGGASKTVGLRRRLIQELENIVDMRGWDNVKNYGSAAGTMRHSEGRTARRVDHAGDLPRNLGFSAVAKETEATGEPSTDPSTIPAHLQQQEKDPISERLSAHSMPRGTSLIPSPMEGSVRALDTLGSWAGASLVSGLRIKGVVEIDRDKFLQHGLVGALPTKKDGSVDKSRPSLAGTGPRPLGEKGEKGSWTLGSWA